MDANWRRESAKARRKFSYHMHTTPNSRHPSVTFSIPILVGSIMAQDIRTWTHLSQNVAPYSSLLSKYETTSNSSVSFSGHELWPVQENGNLREFIATSASCFFKNLAQRAKPATKREMTQFHSDEYVDFLSKITPSNMSSFGKEQHKCWYMWTLSCRVLIILYFR